MPSALALIPTLALLAGAAAGIKQPLPHLWPTALALTAVTAAAAFLTRRPRLLVAAAAAAFGCAGWALAARAADTALHSPLRTELDRRFGGFAIEALTAGGAHDPIRARGVLTEDASIADDSVLLRLRVTALQFDGEWRPSAGGVLVSVGGQVDPARLDGWTAGRTIEAPLTFRRPARYADVGVPDGERDLALAGTTLFAATKSGLLVSVVGRGNRLEELAARIRRSTRRAIRRWVEPHDAQSAAIVTAILIGDRAGLSDPLRARLQAAGTYHVIAISGGQVALLAALSLAILMLCGLSGRAASLPTMAFLAAYGAIVTSSSSVWRATVMGIVYLSARLLDLRTPPTHALAVTAVLLVCINPLAVADSGFALTFGATMALLELAPRIPLGPAGASRSGNPRLARPHDHVRMHTSQWLLRAIAATLAAEAALLPIAAMTFSRMTVAGLALNLVALPATAVAQVAGLIVVAAQRVPAAAGAAAWAAHFGSVALAESARLVDVAPWLTWRLPPPAPAVVLAYYVGLAAAVFARATARVVAVAVWTVSLALIVSGLSARQLVPSPDPRALRLTMFDVGQGESMLLELPAGKQMLIDAGGAPFGTGFDTGARVLAPALWARGVRGLEWLLVTHAHPDHAGGVPSIVADFSPHALWEGIAPPPGAERDALRQGAAAAHLRWRQLYAGMSLDAGAAHLRVLHPPPPDWQRREVRNDDSVVLEIRYGDVALLLTGDIGADVEQAIATQLTPAKVRVLKVAHHGSRTSSSSLLVSTWRPQIALISAGRGNRFGHPAIDVLERLETVGAHVYRTDRDGEIAVTTDGRAVRVRTFSEAASP